MSMEILQHNSVKQCLYAFLAVLSNFHIDVTFEMRTAVQSNVFIQLITTHKIQSSFISEMEKGERGKIAERQKESKHWLAADIALVIKWAIRKYTFLIKKKMVNIWNDCY